MGDILELLGIEYWSLRQNKRDLIHCFQLEQSNKGIGFLLLDSQEELDHNPKIKHFINEVLKSIGLGLNSAGQPLPVDLKEKLDASHRVIALGALAAKFVAEELGSISQCISSYSPQHFIKSPLDKKELWEKIRNFT